MTAVAFILGIAILVAWLRFLTKPLTLPRAEWVKVSGWVAAGVAALVVGVVWGS